MIILPAHKFDAHITSTSQLAHKADGSSFMQVGGEIWLAFYEFHLNGLGVENLAGTPFMSPNTICVWSAKNWLSRLIGLHSPVAMLLPQYAAILSATQLCLLPTPVTIWLGEFVEVPPDTVINSAYIVKPRLDAHSVHKCNICKGWPLVLWRGWTFLISPTSHEHEQFCEPLSTPATQQSFPTTHITTSGIFLLRQQVHKTPKTSC